MRNRFLSLLALVVLAAAYFTDPQMLAMTQAPAQQVKISDKRLQHILYGDKTGGGHMHGQNAPCKSEFPAAWDKDQIVKNITLIAANDNIAWKKQDNGFHTAEQSVDGVLIRVVMNPARTEIITAYPVNVKRNPCPKPANDN
jgi:Bacterial EndoU nuclease